MSYITKILQYLKKPINYHKHTKVLGILNPYNNKYIDSKHVKYSTITDSQKSLTEYEIGTEIFGFKIKEVENIPELQLTAIRLQHLKTGADYLHVARNDSNNVFCVGFRTTPMDSTGVPHILEHSVLCGSEKYPCRDPFFKMLNRSLSTFMNAMTGSDYTLYPFSTQNPTDFRNLMGVYMDATFKPNLSELDFLQEGWRLEHEDTDNSKSPIIIKGVVYNEMKGVFADSQQIFLQKLQNELMPFHTYGYISGGDPLEIPKLTWGNLKDFHKKHYHPSNSRFFTYGDQPLDHHLEFIDTNYLSKYNKINPNTSVPEEPLWEEPRKCHISCGIDPMTSKERQSNIAISYLLTDIKDLKESFMMAVIGELLMGGPNAPFYKSLIETQYGTSFASGSGFDSHTRTTSFTIGLQGVDSKDFEDICKAIEDTFDRTIEEGFPEERLEAILHNIEIGIKHQSSSFGLGLAMSLTPFWNHDGNPIDALRINQKLQDFKKSLTDNPKLLTEKINEFFKANKHKLVLTMTPDTNFKDNLQEVESQNLKQKLQDLSEKEKNKVYEVGQILKHKQELKEDISCLPTLKVSDIPRHVKPTIVKDLKIHNSVPLQLCEQPTNGVTYFRTILDTSHVPQELHCLIPLFTSVLTEMGAGEWDFRTLSQKSELVSGGLSSNVHITDHPESLSKFEEGIILSSHCLQKNLKPMLSLWTKIFNEVRMDDLSRFTTLVKMIAANQANGLVHSGHSYAMSYASSTTNYVSHIKEQWGGLTNLETLKAMSETEDLSETLSKLKNIGEILFKQNKLRIAVNASSEHSDDVVKCLEQFLRTLENPSGSSSCLSLIPDDFTPNACRTHHVFPFPVNFAAKSFPCLPYAHPDTGALRVLARLMFQFLHREIREKGGAYGGGAVSSPGGPFSFYSYRDPHSTQTLKTFDNAVDWILKREFTQQDVDEAKLGVFQKVDSPISPGAKGLRKFYTHISDDLYNSHRISILDAQPQDLVRVCRTYLRESDIESSCLIGPANEHLCKDPSWVTKVHQ